MTQKMQKSIPNSIYGANNIISKLYHNQIRNIYGSQLPSVDYINHPLFQAVYPIMYRYNRPWTQYTYTPTKPIIVDHYYVSENSDTFDNKPMIGMVIYIYKNQSHFKMNGKQERSGLVAILNRDRVLNGDDTSNLWEKLLDIVNGEPTKGHSDETMIASTFTINNKGECKALSQCICSSEMIYRQYEYECIEALVSDWISSGSRSGYISICDVLQMDRLKIPCIPYDRLEHHFNMHDSLTESTKLFLYTTMMKHWHSLYDSHGMLHNSRAHFRDLILASASPDITRVSFGKILRFYMVLEKAEAKSIEGIMELYTKIKSYITGDVIDNIDWRNLETDNVGTRDDIKEDQISVYKQSLKEDKLPFYPIKVDEDCYGVNIAKIICVSIGIYHGVRFRYYKDSICAALVSGFIRNASKSLSIHIPTDISSVVIIFYPNLMAIETGLNIEDIRLKNGLLCLGSRKIQKELDQYI